MKLLMVTPSLTSGGAERVVSALSQEWAKNHEVKVVVFDTSHLFYAYGGELVDLDLPVRGFRGWVVSKAVQVIRQAVSLARLFREMKPDRVLSFMEASNFPCILAELIAGDRSRLWVSVHSDPELLPTYQKLLISLLYWVPDKVVAVSNGIAQALADMGVSKAKVLSITNPLAPCAPTLLTPLSRPADAPDRYILGVGRLHRHKGFDRLIESFALLNNKSVHLVILGEGNEHHALESQASVLGVSDRVHLLGVKKDVWPWYRHAVCFVVSSRFEGWGNVLMEAMSQSCPVISFDCKYGPSEIIEDGVSGRLIDEGSVEAMSKALQEIIDHPEQRKELGEQGMKRALDFEITKIAKMWSNCSFFVGKK